MKHVFIAKTWRTHAGKARNHKARGVPMLVAQVDLAKYLVRSLIERGNGWVDVPHALRPSHALKIPTLVVSMVNNIG